jgi:hypothetical protein
MVKVGLQRGYSTTPTFFRAKTLRLYAQKYHFQIKTIEYTNRIYSRPATGRGLFRRRFLRKAGVSWEESVGSPHGFFLKVLGSSGVHSIIA